MRLRGVWLSALFASGVGLVVGVLSPSDLSATALGVGAAWIVFAVSESIRRITE